MRTGRTHVIGGWMMAGAAMCLLMTGCPSKRADTLPGVSKNIQEQSVEDTDNRGKGSNRLSDASSPYLLQHADNPVDWYPWSPEAFEKARREDKPIFLSIGYSACHWCHVMERESFEDSHVAELMNDLFVSIKVDREERPDIDNVYMTTCQLMTGSGGWPLTIVMTPDKEPFFAATYVPKETRFGHPGMLELLPRLGEIWSSRRDDIAASASKIIDALRQATATNRGQALDATVLDEAHDQLASRFDGQYGGFGTAPKFPTPHNLLFLLRYAERSGTAQPREMVETTLRHMARSGTFDQVGFGFHRYSTDREWKVPHFEKMLYDQALLLLAYTEAYQATGDAGYAVTAHRICTYVLRDLMSPEGAFYSAENADSEGIEGKFYVWTLAEIGDVLGPEKTAIASAVYNLKPEGNFRVEAGDGIRGANILYRTQSLDTLAAELGMPQETLTDELEQIRRALFDAREQRVRPSLDDKILTNWNGLMIAALARAGRVLSDPEYTDGAQRAAAFLLDRLRDDSGGLLHRYRRGKAGIRAHADDYAFLVWGLLELYETTFDVRHIETAIALQDQMIRHFWDQEAGGFYFIADDAEALPVRQKEIYDGAVPSANSVSMLNLLRIGRITGRDKYETTAEALDRAFAETVRRAPSGFPMFLCGVDFALGPSYEVVIVCGDDDSSLKTMLDALRGVFVPNKVVVVRPPDDDSPITAIAPFTKPQRALEGRATAYVCRNHACTRPTTDPEEMRRGLAAADGEEERER